MFSVADVRKLVRATDNQQRAAKWEEAPNQARTHRFVVTCKLLLCQLVAEVSFSVRMCNSEQPVSFWRRILQAEDTMNWKSQDWIEHASFGLGRVNENRGDRLDIDFISSGSKTILRTAELKRANPPSLDFEFPRAKRKSPSSTSKMSV